MISLGLVLFSVSLADLVAGGLAGEPRQGRRVLAGVFLALATCSAASFGLIAGGARIPALVLGPFASSAWLLAKFPWKGPSNWERPRWALLALAAPLAISVVVATHDSAPGALDAWLEASPFARASSMQAGEWVLLCGVLLFLTAPANGIVRAVLTVAGTPWSRSAERLRGGRLIGVLERWLIFGLAMAGEPTAAALIVSAKSLLRFPEISKMPKDPPNTGLGVSEIDTVTEYFLLGSLLSWTIALAPVLLFSRLPAQG